MTQVFEILRCKCKLFELPAVGSEFWDFVQGLRIGLIGAHYTITIIRNPQILLVIISAVSGLGSGP